jgi:hypothetical protein
MSNKKGDKKETKIELSILHFVVLVIEIIMER